MACCTRHIPPLSKQQIIPWLAVVLREGECETVAELEDHLYRNCRNGCFPSPCATGPERWCANTQRFLFDELETLRAAEPVKPHCLKTCVLGPVSSACVNMCAQISCPRPQYGAQEVQPALRADARPCEVTGNAEIAFFVQILGFPNLKVLL